MIRRVVLLTLALALASAAQDSRAAFVTFTANLSGSNESPPNATPGTGSAVVDIDSVAHLHVHVIFSGLTGGNTAAHIHSTTLLPFTSTAGVATSVPTFTDFPGGVTSGTYDHTFDMTLASSYNPAFVTANGGNTTTAEAALFNGIMTNRAYLNIHTASFPNGEIRGFLEAVPEPASIAMMGTGLLGVIAYAWRKKIRTRA